MGSVTFVSARYLPYIGGIETHVSELAKRAQARFGGVSVVTTDPLGLSPPVEQEANGLTIYRVRSFAPNENYHFPSLTLVKRLKQCRSEILHVHGIHDLPGPVAGLLETEASVVLTPHYSGTVYTRLGRALFHGYRPLLLRLIKKVDCVICMSQFEARSMADKFPGSREKIHVIPNGVDPILQSRYHWQPPDPPRILYAGRLERSKNVDKIVQAFYQLRKEWPELELTIHGKGPFRPELGELVKSLGVNQHTEWSPRTGVSRDALYQCYASSTVLVYPSDFECFGIVPAEAMSLGTPTVVTNSTALAEFVQAGMAQPVEPPVTAEKLKTVISGILEHPRSFSKNPYQGNIVSWDSVAERTWNLYESLGKK